MLSSFTDKMLHAPRWVKMLLWLPLGLLLGATAWACCILYAGRAIVRPIAVWHERKHGRR